MNKRGMGIKEIVKIAIAVFILAVLVGAVIFLFKGGGGEVLASVHNWIRGGGAYA